MTVNCISTQKRTIHDGPRTRVSDSKHLTALTHSIFLVNYNILSLCLLFALPTKKLAYAVAFELLLATFNFNYLIDWFKVFSQLF